jgi:hypothetical protein
MSARWVGAAAGGIGGVAIGLGITFYLYGSDPQLLSWMMRVLIAAIVGAIGAALGAVSGLSRD